LLGVTQTNAPPTTAMMSDDNSCAVVLCVPNTAKTLLHDVVNAANAAPPVVNAPTIALSNCVTN
jgi:hypothetical protein